MIELSYIFNEFRNRKFIKQDYYTKRAREYASQKKIHLATYALLYNNEGEVTEVWAPDNDEWDSWSWYNKDEHNTYYYKTESAQQSLKRLLDIFDIPVPGEEEDHSPIEEMIF